MMTAISLGLPEDQISGADKFEIRLMPGNKIVIELKFATAYEASVAYDALSDACGSGHVRLAFSTKGIR